MYRILIADDEYYFREAMKKSFPWEEYGCTVCGEARNGAEALHKMKELHPDIVLVDINMPFMNGLDFIREAKELSEDIAYIIISGYEEFDDARTAIRLGVSGYLLKPVQEEELAGVLRETLEIIRAKRAERTEIGHLRAAAGGKYLRAARRAGLTVALNSKSLEETLRTVRAVYEEDLPGGDRESLLLASEELIGMLVETTDRQRDAAPWFGGVGEALLRTLSGRNTADELKDYLIELYRSALILMLKDRMSPAVSHILEYICANYDNPELTIDRIAGHVFLNYYYLCTQFKKETGCTVNHFLMSLRLQRAFVLLAVKKKGPEQTAFEVGMSDCKYFNKCFKKRFGMTARELIGRPTI